MREIKLSAPWIPAFLAALIFSGWMTPGLFAWKILGFTAMAFLLTQIVFKGLQILIPKRTIPLLTLLSWSVLAYALYGWRQVPVFWILSLLFLSGENLIKEPSLDSSSVFYEKLSESLLKTLHFIFFSTLFLGTKEMQPAFFPNQKILWTGALALLWIIEESASIIRMPALKPSLIKTLSRELAWIFLLTLAVVLVSRALFSTDAFFHKSEVLILTLPLTYLFCAAGAQKQKSFLVIYSLAMLLCYELPALSLKNQIEVLLIYLAGLGILILGGWAMMQRLKFAKPPKWINFTALFFILFLVQTAVLKNIFEAFPVLNLPESISTSELLDALA